jgi:hypothetical protein
MIAAWHAQHWIRVAGAAHPAAWQGLCGAFAVPQAQAPTAYVFHKVRQRYPKIPRLWDLTSLYRVSLA